MIESHYVAKGRSAFQLKAYLKRAQVAHLNSSTGTENTVAEILEIDAGDEEEFVSDWSNTDGGTYPIEFTVRPDTYRLQRVACMKVPLKSTEMVYWTCMLMMNVQQTQVIQVVRPVKKDPRVRS